MNVTAIIIMVIYFAIAAALKDIFHIPTEYHYIYGMAIGIFSKALDKEVWK